jgi:YVTN family beta-propeller protein
VGLKQHGYCVILTVFMCSALSVVHGGTYAYVSNTNNDATGNTVQQVDLESNSVVATITVGTFPNGMAQTLDGSRVYVANSGESTVSVIDTANNAVIATVAVGGSPGGLAVSPDGNFVYVSNWHGWSISVIEIATNSVIATIPAISYPGQLVFSPDGRRLFVVNLWRNFDPNQPGAVTVIDTTVNQVVRTIPMPDATAGMAITPDGRSLYVTEVTLNQVIKISTLNYKVMTKISVGSRPVAIVVSRDGKFAYVADSALFGGSPDVEIIKLSSGRVVRMIGVGTDPVALALNSVGTYLYVINQLSNTISVVNTGNNTVTATVPVGTGPTVVVLSP